jgi:hypothetical protein
MGELTPDAETPTLANPPQTLQSSTTLSSSSSSSFNLRQPSVPSLSTVQVVSDDLIPAASLELGAFA